MYGTTVSGRDVAVKVLLLRTNCAECIYLFKLSAPLSLSRSKKGFFPLFACLLPFGGINYHFGDIASLVGAVSQVQQFVGVTPYFPYLDQLYIYAFIVGLGTRRK